MFWEPDILGVQDSKLYVGFYVARLATIEVSNISLSVSAAAADAPRIAAPVRPPVASLEVLSLSATSRTDYTLIAKTNTAGTLTVKQGYRTLVRDVEVEAGLQVRVPATLAAGGTAPFSLAFVPDYAQALASYDTLMEKCLHHSTLILSGDYWYVKGIDFARSAADTKGFTVGGSHNTIESCRFYENGDTGLQISRTDLLENDKAKWPSNNLILSCESFDNRDPSENNADGFAAKLTSGSGNIFRGCLSHHNIDDGWDLYTKAGTGAIGPVLIESCIAYGNGTLKNGTVGKGDKNGFKLGGEGITVPHIIRGSLAFGNGATGFTNNSNPGVIGENNYAYDNGLSNLNLSTYANVVPQFRFTGFSSYRTRGGARDIVPDSLRSPQNYLFNGSASVNASGAVLTFEAFVPALRRAGFQEDMLPSR